MNTAKRRLWVSDGELWRCGVNHWEVKEDEVLRDHHRYGYWLSSDSKTAIILALKGCRFHAQESTTPRLSSVLGSSFLKSYP